MATNSPSSDTSSSPPPTAPTETNESKKKFSLEDFQDLGIDLPTLKLIRQTVGEDVPASSLFELCYTAVKYNLDPIRKEVYLMPKAGKWYIYIAIDGLRRIAHDTGNYAPGKETEFEHDESGNLISAVAYVKLYHPPSGTWNEVSARAYYKEYVQTRQDKASGQNIPNSMWGKMPHSQLEKCAEAKALRRAFPALAKMYIAEESVDTNTGEVKAVNRPSNQMIKSLRQQLGKDNESTATEEESHA